MLHSIDKNRGTHGDSSFMLDGLPSSRENPLSLGMGSVNGDAMRDPEMTFSVNEAEKSILPLSFRNDYMGMNVEYFRNQNGRISYLSTWLHDGDQFLRTWTQNLIDQGFIPEQSLVLI